METTPAIEVKQPQMQPLKVEPQSKLMEEEVRTIHLEVGVEPLVVQNEITETVARQLKAQDVIQ